MPGYERVAFTAELTVTLSEGAEKKPPKEPLEAAKETAGASGLAHESGPETILLAGGREVLEAAMKTIEAALDAGAREVTLKVEAEGDAPRFGDGDER